MKKFTTDAVVKEVSRDVYGAGACSTDITLKLVSMERGGLQGELQLRNVSLEAREALLESLVDPDFSILVTVEVKEREDDS